MSTYDEPTQQVRRPQPPPAPLPGSLDPLRGHEAGEPEAVETGTGWVDTADGDPGLVADTTPPTGVLPLDELFDAPAPAAPVSQPEPTAAAEAPTWTAMPVLPIRSEPLSATGGPAATAWTQPAAPTPPQRAESLTRIEDWLRRDDNGLMLLTALVACVLMIVVAGVGR
jgi:hypothetical protein